eukprot:gnl/TRDRNA2_/TRDRNA2_126522_c0_seq1.p2 gnl/TRDRNA2_/TRDRNA2_126522_c0~~gnl/TRDRNA2_/TRDRNA2_126522_c0_seq1.p2  ORF type:complete len:228 (+),score=41.36 gnl/TRDRNA2_/TRDRNA2_126522_c0_seq1:45-728(+)
MVLRMRSAFHRSCVLLLLHDFMYPATGRVVGPQHSPRVVTKGASEQRRLRIPARAKDITAAPLQQLDGTYRRDPLGPAPPEPTVTQHLASIACKGTSGSLKAASSVAFSRWRASQPAFATWDLPNGTESEDMLFQQLFANIQDPLLDGDLDGAVGAKFAGYVGLGYTTQEQKIAVWHHIAELLVQTLREIAAIPCGCALPANEELKAEADDLVKKNERLKEKLDRMA